MEVNSLTGRGAKLKSSREEHILHVSGKLFLEKGYAATSITDICKAAQINRPTLYWYFKSKEEIYFSSHIKLIQDLVISFTKKVKCIEHPEARLNSIIPEFTRVICKYPEFKSLVQNTPYISEQYLKKIQQASKELFGELKSSIEDLQFQGRMLNMLNPSWAALFILGMMMWITFWFNFNNKDRVDELANQVLMFALQGLRVR
ncbi:MAG: TetR/AcrR family transcriptional regulator [Desulfobacteraceae bacterium]|nr:MAG: TetR/AcrR family transcriptional regulator [Desulfobacteraceae bacterium]